MTRTEAVAWQERLFPRGLWRRYKQHGEPDGNNYRSIPPTLPEIVLELRAAINGSADSWQNGEISECADMLKARLDTWEWLHKEGQEYAIDAAVYTMVQAAVNMARDYLNNEGYNPKPE